MSKTILVPIDGSETAFKALEIAAEYFYRRGDKFLLLHVFQFRRIPNELKRYLEVEHIPGPPETQYKELIASGILEDGKERASKMGVKKIEMISARGDSAKTIVKQSKKLNADMIVIGNRGIGKVTGMAFGSVSQKVTHYAKCAVITVK